MTPQDLAAFPYLAQIFAAISPQPVLAELPIARVHQLGPHYVEDVERMITEVVRNGHALAALQEQTNKLFQPDWNAWDSARTELHALSVFASDGTLDQIGWPAGHGDAAPFEGVLRDRAGGGAHIAFDVKTAEGSGALLLRERLSPIAEHWAGDIGLKPVAVSTKHRGPTLTQESISGEVGRLMKEFEAGLRRLSTVPAIVQLRASNQTEIEVLVEEETGSSVHAGTGSVDERVKSLANVIARHAAKKNQTAAQHQRPFLLVYVAPFGSAGADMRPDDVIAAARLLDAAGAQPPLWLGVLMLDRLRGPLNRQCHLCARATWPQGSSPASLRATIRC